MTQFPTCKRIRQLYCRVCGQRQVGAGPRWFSVLNFRVVLRRLHDADVESESPEMYPRGVCKGPYLNDVYTRRGLPKVRDGNENRPSRLGDF